MINVLGTLRKIFRKPIVKYGMPFFVLVLSGSLGLKEFQQLRFQYSTTAAIKPEDAEAYGVKMKKPGEVTLESEYEKIKSLDIDNWEIVRGPRPWEENTLKK